MAGLAVAALSTAAGIGFANLEAAGIIGTGEALAGAIGTTGGLFAAGRSIINGIKGDIAHWRSKRMDIDSAYKRKYPGSTSDVERSVRRRIEFNMDQLAVAAGNRTTTNRYVNKVKLRSGRIGRKLQKESEEFIQRWQRIYNFGNNNVAYPTSATEELNPGITVATWEAVPPTNANVNTGRLMLSHVEDVTGREGWRLMPGYLFDLTCWRNTSNTYQPSAMQRLAFDNLGNVRLVQCAQQGDPSSSANSFLSRNVYWAGESGPSGTAVPTSTEQKALLSWSDIRLAIYGAKKRCAKVHVEFIQFKDDKYIMDFHPDGELVANMTQLDRNDVNLFWLNEFKRLTFNPLVVNTFLRNKAIKVMRSETFCINADEIGNEEPGPPVVHKQYFKRFNRLVNWAWNTANLTLTANKDGMEDPDYQVSDQGQLLGYANPKSRIYMYIRAEDFEPVVGNRPLSIPITAANVTSSIAPTTDPAPPGGATYSVASHWAGVYNPVAATENAGGFIGTDKSVSGYVPVVQSTNQTCYLPTFSVSDPAYASDNHVSFDIIVRNKWRIQT